MAIQSFSVGQVLTAAQVNALQANDYNQTVSNKTGSYTLVAADKGTRVTMSSTSATTITVNTDLFSAGDTLFIQNLNSGVSTITAGTATVTTASSLALAQWEGGTLYFTSASAAIFFKSDGATAASGGMTLISETVASALSSLSFSSLGSYKQLLLVWSGVVHSTTGSDFSIRLNNDSTANIYQSNGINVVGTTIYVGGSGATSLKSENGASNVFPFGTSVTLDAGCQTLSNGFITIDNYTSASKFKTIDAKFSYYDNASSVYRTANNLFVFQSQTAVTSIDVVRLTGSATFSNKTNTTIRLYGVS
jgi:hypothetical protein